MKIHHNNEMNTMLKNGTARVIVYKDLPYLRAESRGAGPQNVPSTAAEPADVPVSVPAAPVTAPELTPELTEQAVTADVGIGAVANPETTDLSLEAAFIDKAQDVMTEPALPDDISDAATSVLPDKTPEMMPAADLPAATPEAVAEPVLPDEVPDAAPASVMPDAAPAMITEPVLPAAKQEAEIEPAPPLTEQPKTVQSVKINVIQPESAPGGLIARIDFTSDPSGLVFGSPPEYVSMIPAITDVLSESDGIMEEDPSYPPYINFTCFNRLGLTIKTLTNLLDSDEDFELNIIDSNSQDNTWDYIQSLNDRRIKSRIRFEKNCGPIFAVNFALSRRKPNQYFIVIDSDTFIKTKNWIARFMEVFSAFPEVGLLGLMRDNPYPRYMPPIIPRVNGALSYLELKNADINAIMDFVPGQLQCLRPALIKEVGYWSEENGFGDAELSPRIVHYTNFTAGFLTTIEIDMTQKITCDECLGKEYCKLDRSICDCFMLSRQYNKNESYVAKNTWKFKQTFQELSEGNRTVYCASIHDPESMKTHKYYADWAYENFNHYIINAN